MTHRSILYVAPFLIVFFLVCDSSKAQTNQNTNLEEAKKAIEASNAIYFDSYVKNDSSIFINRYAKDACILVPNEPTICGRVGAANFFKISYQEYGMRNGKFITTAVYGDGKEYVTEEGLWQSYDVDGQLFDDGKFLVLWKKTPEGWKMFRDSFTSNHSLK